MLAPRPFVKISFHTPPSEQDVAAFGQALTNGFNVNTVHQPPQSPNKPHFFYISATTIASLLDFRTACDRRQPRLLEIINDFQIASVELVDDLSDNRTQNFPLAKPRLNAAVCVPQG